MTGVWIKTSDGIFLFGPGGVTRFDEHKHYNYDGKRSDYITALYAGTSHVGTVKNSIEDIEKYLKEFMPVKGHPHQIKNEVPSDES